MSYHKVVLLLGSNLNHPEKNIARACKIIAQDVGEILNESELLHTRAVEFASNNIFCNIALLIKTQLSPIKTLKKIKEIEKRMGRTQDSAELGGYADRVIDIDIVTFDNVEFHSEQLDIPHEKHLHQRGFSKALLHSLM